MNHTLPVEKRLKPYWHLGAKVSLTILLASTLGMQGCAEKMAYGGRYVDIPVLSTTMGIGRGGYDKANVRIAKLDFVPIDRADYKLKWTGNAVRYSDCYHFKPIIELEEPAPKTFTRDFDIVKDRSWPFADEMIGGFSVTFTQGSKVPSENQIIYPASLISSSQAPIATPDPVTGKFWMGCTRKKKIKANADKDGETGNLYITLSPVMIPADGVTIGGVGSSPKHNVRCQAIGSGGGGGGFRTCNYDIQKCCGFRRPDDKCDGQCWPKGNPCP